MDAGCLAAAERVLVYPESGAASTACTDLLVVEMLLCFVCKSARLELAVYTILTEHP